MSAEIVFGHYDFYGAKRSLDEIRIIKEMLDEDVNRFVAESSIDAPAANELKSEALEIQWAVLQRGPVRSASNPSAALVGRIRDAKRMKLSGGGPPPPAAALPAITTTTDEASLSEVDRFIMENRLDQSAARSLKAEHLDVQKTVMAQGPLIKCYNPSGALMGRIRAARLGQRAYMPSAGTPAASMPALADAAPAYANGQPAGGESSRLVDEEAKRAIERFKGGGAEAPAQAGPPPAAAGAGGGSNGGGAPTPAAFANVEDARLNEEALKAIQSLNAGGLERMMQPDIVS